MKSKLALLSVALLLGQFVWADAGFSISRRKAPTRVTFEGTASLSGYTLVRINYTYHDSDWRKLNPQLGRMDTINDAYYDYVQDGGRHWEESERYLHYALLDTAGKITDSFTLFMKKYDNHLRITGVNGGKLQYTIKKKKAVFQYGVLSDDGEGENHRLARTIFILCSLTGLAALIVLFFKKRKTQLA